MEKNIFKDKKLRTLLTVEIVALCVLVALFIIDATKLPQKLFGSKNSYTLELAEDAADSPAGETNDEPFVPEYNDAMLDDMYATLLCGDYTSEEGYKFNFEGDGTYEGYVNSNTLSAQGKYSVYSSDDMTHTVVIEVKGEKESFLFDFNENGDLVLTGADGNTFRCN